MKVKSPGAAKVGEASATEQRPAADLRAQGRKLLERARQAPLVSPSLLGLSQASLDTLAAALLDGASRAAQRRSGSGEE